ncbi:hypothetical protein P3S67_015231 [Capsicum chacoense]
MNNISSLVSAGSPSGNYIQMEETNDKDTLSNPNSVLRRKRSELKQRILSHIERLQRKFYINLQEPDFDDIAVDFEIFTLIYAPNKYISPNEIGLGSMLLVSLTTTTERSTSLSPMKEDDASFAVNVLVETPLVLPTTSIEHSTSSSPMEEDNVDCSTVSEF